MKGLLIKDFKLLKYQKSFFGIIIVVGLLFSVSQNNPYMAIGYGTIMVSIFTLTTFAYDEADNGCAYLFTLPFSRKEYVKGKYIFGFLISLAGLAVSIILEVVFCFVKTQILKMSIEFEWMAVGVISLAAITMCVFFLAAAIPVEIKLGVEKGRIGYVLVMAVFFVGYYLIMKVVEKVSCRNPQEFIEKFLNLHLAAIIGILVVTWIIVISISMLISIRLINKKEY